MIVSESETRSPLEADRIIYSIYAIYSLSSSSSQVVDSQNLSTPSGTQHSQRKQLEVLQTRTANGGSIQVVRSQTIQSSRWSSSNVHNSISNQSSSFLVSPQLVYLSRELFGKRSRSLTDQILLSSSHDRGLLLDHLPSQVHYPRQSP